jgi:hypothetical protein
VAAENLGAEWQQRFGAALIVRHDKDGAAWYDGDDRALFRRFRRRLWTPLAQATATRAARLPGWRRDGHWQMPFCWGMPWRPGWSATAAGIAPRLARNYSSHTKTYRSLRQ